MPNQHELQHNALLAALSTAAYERLAGELELVELVMGEVLYEAGQTLSHAYFPIDCIISLLYEMNNGESAQIAVVGNEGMIGIALFMGGESTSTRAVVQNSGHAYRLKGQALKDEFLSNGILSHLMLMFASVMITQMVQTAACNRHHLVSQQLCRWILLSLDRMGGNKIPMTEALIAKMLNLEPSDVSNEASVLERVGCIHYRDGDITVLDRARLEKRVCECYEVVKTESARLLALASALRP